MPLYQYNLSCGHRKVTSDKYHPGAAVRCFQCEWKGHDEQRLVEDCFRLRDSDTEGDEEDTRG